MVGIAGHGTRSDDARHTCGSETCVSNSDGVKQYGLDKETLKKGHKKGAVPAASRARGYWMLRRIWRPGLKGEPGRGRFHFKRVKTIMSSKRPSTTDVLR